MRTTQKNSSNKSNNTKKRNQGQRPGQSNVVPKKGNPNKSIAAAYTRVQGPQKIQQSSRNGVLTVKWKEFVQDIPGSVAFSPVLYPVQPGVPTLFAWLSQQAIFYQEYQFKKLRFCYETEKGSSTNGKVMFALQEDATDAAPASKQEMLENEWKASAAPWEPFSLSVPTKILSGLGPRKFVRSGTLAANLDLKTYDVGQLVVATLGMADTSNVGELFVEYEVDLFTPVMSSKQLASISSKLITGVTPSSVSLFGTTPTLTSGLSATATVNTITFQRVGNYMVDVFVFGTGLFTAFQPVTSASTATNISLKQAQGISNAAANGGTLAMVTIFCTVTARGQTLVIDCSTQATTITASDTDVSGFVSAFP